MSYKTFTRSTIITVLLLLLSAGAAFGRDFTSASGEQLPDYYPSSFQGTGTLRTVSSRDVVISGNGYALSMNVLIHSTATEHSSRYELVTGRDVGFSFGTDSDNNSTITEIWILPDGSLLQH